MATFIFLRGLSGYVLVNVLTLSPPRETFYGHISSDILVTYNKIRHNILVSVSMLRYASVNVRKDVLREDECV